MHMRKKRRGNIQSKLSSLRDDNKMSGKVVNIATGDFFVAKSNEIISTTLGSCVAACIRDEKLGIGGMNHFMLPSTSDGNKKTWEATNVSTAARYGTYAMEFLINSILDAGGHRKHLEFKLFGGGNIVGSLTTVGAVNVNFIREFMKTEGFPIAAESMGGSCPIKLNYQPKTGIAKIKRLDDLASKIAAIEKEFMDNFDDTAIDGDVTLF